MTFFKLKRAVIKLNMVDNGKSNLEGISHLPGVNGGRATIVRTRIPVWVLVSFRNQGASDAEILNNFPSLTADDLVNAWSYYANHAEEIERDLAEQEEE